MNSMDYCCRDCNDGLPYWEWELLHGKDADTAPVSSPGEVFKKYAAEIDKMYANRTRGDYSSIGILSEFYREMKEAESQ